MSHSFIDPKKNYYNVDNDSDTPQKKIDPVAQLKWLNTPRVHGGWGLFNLPAGRQGNQPAQMFAQDEIKGNGMPINDNAVLENEADEMGVKATQCKMADVAGKGSLVQRNAGVNLVSDNYPSEGTVPSEFLPYIDFIAVGSNEAGYTVSSNSIGPILPVGENLLDEFSTGVGPTNRVFLGDHPMTIALKNARMVEYAKFFFYKKYKDNIQNGNSLAEASVTNYKGTFGFSGLLLAGFDLTEQYVGSFTVDIFAINEGQDIVIRVTNSTSMTSAGYRITNEYHRDNEKKTPGGNTYQIYIWKEKIDSKAFFKEHYKVINEIDWSKYGSGIR